MYDYYNEPEYYNPEDFLEEYESSIREILVNATNEKIKNTIEELNEIKLENEELIKERNDLRSKLHNIEYSQKQVIEKAFKDGYKEAEKKLGLGFAVNDTVYYIDYKNNQTKCTKCNGDYKIKIDILGVEKEVNCPHCSYGKVSNYTYHPKKDTIRSLNFSISRQDYNRSNSPAELKVEWGIKVWLDKKDYEVNINSLYHSEEECQKACDEKKNNQK